MGNTLLHTALSRPESEIITEFLIKQHLDINAVNEDGITPFMIAAEYRSLLSAMLLLQGVVDIYRENKQGRTALDLVGGDGEWNRTNPVRQFVRGYIRQKRREEFCMSSHKRLGGDSDAYELHDEVFKLIHDQVNDVE